MNCFLLFVVCVCVVVRSCSCVAIMIPSASPSASCPVNVDYGVAYCDDNCFNSYGFLGTFVGGPKSYIKQQGQVTLATINWWSIPQGTVMLSRLMRNPLNETQFKLVDQTTLTGQVLRPGQEFYRVNPPMFVDQGDFVGVTIMLSGDFMNFRLTPWPQNGTSMFYFFGEINKEKPYWGFKGTDEFEMRLSVRVTTQCSSTGTGTGTGGTGTGTETGTVSSSSSSHAVIISSTAQQSSSSSSSSVSFTLTLAIGVGGGVVALLLIVGIWVYIKKKRSSGHNVSSLNQSLLTTQP